MARNYSHSHIHDAHPAHVHPASYGAGLRRSRPLYRTTQTVWYLLYIAETFLLVRFALRLFNANPLAPFVDFVYAVSAVFLAPFRYIFPSTLVAGAGSIIEWSTLFAMLAYWLFALGIVKLIVMSRPVSSLQAEERLDHVEDRVGPPLP